MLTYSHRGRHIRVARPPTAGASKGTIIATIDGRTFDIRAAEGIEIASDDWREIESSAQELRSADGAKRAATLDFTAASNRAVKYYLEKATALDKQLIAGTIRSAARAIRKAEPPKAKATIDEKRTSAPISPEVIAKALFQALEANTAGKVKGDPSAAKRTEIRGFWDLNEVARILLSQT